MDVKALLKFLNNKDNREKFAKYLVEKLDETRNTLQAEAFSHDRGYEKVFFAEEKDLPVLAVDKDQGTRDWAARRLKGEDIGTPQDWKDLLADCEFDFGDTKHLAQNDGAAFLLYALFQTMGDEDLAQQALACVYDN